MGQLPNSRARQFAQRQNYAAGGRLAAFQPGEGDDEGYLLKVLPRHNALVRPRLPTLIKPF